MNNKLLHKVIQEFISQNWKTDPLPLLLKKPLFEGVSQKELVQQLIGKSKSTYKLPTWHSTEGIYYPEKLNLEQTSSEITAAYKANLVNGNSIIDITGGFGVDCFFFSTKFEQVYHCEIDTQLSKIAAHNFKTLNANHITTITNDGLSFLKETEIEFDWIYVDPSRRDSVKRKVFLLEDCLPNLVTALDFLFLKTSNILIKTSPLLDISQGLKDLKFVKEIHVIAVKNEVKELLWILEREFEGSTQIKTVNFKNNEVETFNFLRKDEVTAKVLIGEPKQYLFEPNAAILKSGGFKSLSRQLNLEKLHEHSHLYTSKELIAFPGRRFRIEKVIPFNKKEIQRLKLDKANVTTRNFPHAVADIRKKYKLKDGGDAYLFFTTDSNNKKVVIVCTKEI